MNTCIHSADESHKQQLAERSEESEYETISQDEGLVSPTITPYAIDDDVSSFTSSRPLKRTRSRKEEPTTGRPIEQPKGATSAPNIREHSQEQVSHGEGSSQHPSKEAAGPSDATTATGSTSSSAPSTPQEDGNRKDGKDSAPKKRSSPTQNTQESLPNNQQATMSPRARANLSQEMNYTAASDQQPMASSTGSVNEQQQQQQPEEGSHQHHMHIRIFILQRRAPRYVSCYTDMRCRYGIHSTDIELYSALVVLMHYLLNILKIMFFASILYFMYTKEMIPLPPFSGREKLYVLKRM